ncbi:hypothetical protein [Sorangium sp. So ce854]|uniref:hypothetical protein n=1 Tax=Sorangium sp. So ce854 TaxID=3133322 RepID=UPI003F639AF6
MKTLGFAAILVSVCAMAACTVTSGGGDGGAGGEGGEGGATTTTTTSSSGGGDGGGTGGEGGAGVCADATEDECFDCCDEAEPDALTALGGYGFWECGCAEESPCADVCDTTDATTDACGDDGTIIEDVQNADCVMCLNELSDDDACFVAATDACDADEECKPYLECLLSCQE